MLLLTNERALGPRNYIIISIRCVAIGCTLTDMEIYPTAWWPSAPQAKTPSEMNRTTGSSEIRRDEAMLNASDFD